MSEQLSEKWIRPQDRLPVRDQNVEWLPPSGGDPVKGSYCGVWMLPGGMYVYYTPSFWRPLKEANRG